MVEQPIIRTTVDVRSSMPFVAPVRVRAVVDPTGAVVSVALENSNLSPELQQQAIEAAEAARYRPFERHGHPVAVTLELWVRVLPPEIVPKTRVPFPTVRDWNSVRIRLTRDACFGACPDYSVEVRGDGTVLYEGREHVALRGSHRAAIPKERVRELVEAFRAADYYSLRDEYVWEATDLPTYETSIEIDGRAKKVKDYSGAMVGMPLSVSELEHAIDRTADSERWIEGNENTVPSLIAEKWNFKSIEAAEALARVTRSGSAVAVAGFLSAGVSLNASSEAAATALRQAANRGDADMLKSLLAAGLVNNAKAMNAALQRAAASGKPEALRLLLAGGASPDWTDPNGGTLLMAAAISGVPEVVVQALAFDRNVNARTKTEGRTALMMAVAQPDSDPEGAEVNRAKVARLLLEKGANPNLKDGSGSTALIDCAHDADAAQVLIDHGADLNAQDNQGFTALMSTSDIDVVRVLIASGEDLSLRSMGGTTALEMAQRDGWSDKERLIEAAQQRR
jgi:TonB family protein